MQRFAWLVLMTVLSGCGPSEPEPPAFSEEELKLQIARTPPGPDQRERATEALHQRKRMVADAKARGLDQDPAVRRALDSVLIQAWQEAVVTPRVEALSVSEDELRRAYQNSLERWTTPATVTVAHILRRSRPEDSARRQRDRQLLEGLREQAEKLPVSEGFGSLAAEHSQDQSSRYRDGILNPLTKGQDYTDWRAKILAAANIAVPGAILPLVETPRGLHLLRVVERHPARTRSFESVRASLRSKILVAKEEDIRREALENLSQ
jgi:peptidyl-prolyl cis-trans isomerase C